MLKEKRAEFGNGFGRTNLFDMVQFAESFPEVETVRTLPGLMGWTYFWQIIYLDDPVLFERTAVGKKPAETIGQDPTAPRDGDRGTPGLVFREASFAGMLDAPAAAASGRRFRQWDFMGRGRNVVTLLVHACRVAFRKVRNSNAGRLGVEAGKDVGQPQGGDDGHAVDGPVVEVSEVLFVAGDEVIAFLADGRAKDRDVFGVQGDGQGEGEGGDGHDAGGQCGQAVGPGRPLELDVSPGFLGRQVARDDLCPFGQQADQGGEVAGRVTGRKQHVGVEENLHGGLDARAAAEPVQGLADGLVVAGELGNAVLGVDFDRDADRRPE